MNCTATYLSMRNNYVAIVLNSKIFYYHVLSFHAGTYVRIYYMQLEQLHMQPVHVNK